MIGFLKTAGRLVRVGLAIARHDVIPEREIANAPAAARLALRAAKLVAGKPASGKGSLNAALIDLGPSYIKFGQFMATRPDFVGIERARELAQLQDRMPPFDQALAREAIEKEFSKPVDSLFSELGTPVAAASIAQVHRAKTSDGRDVAVKILRPGIEARFRADMDSQSLAARIAERFSPQARRLRLVDSIATLRQTVEREMDLRMEAAAMSEMAENTRDDEGFRIPAIDWQRTSKRILTCEWVDGIALNDLHKLKQAGVDLEKLAEQIVQSFLKHAIRDGLFHADMHQGNLFVDRSGNLVAVDFGIIGRLSVKERLYLAEILYGFVKRDYRRVSQVHFEAGYVPGHHGVDEFAQALRSIGEPIMDKRAEDISMGRLLGQLFEVTGQFDMVTQPQLLLLQKTQVVVEGVARSLNPKFNMWETAEPVLREWIEKKLGPQGRMEEVAEGAIAIGKVATGLPEVIDEARRTAHMLAGMAERGGLGLDERTTQALAKAQSRQGRSGRIALWVAAISLAVIALAQLM